MKPIDPVAYSLRRVKTPAPIVFLKSWWHIDYHQLVASPEKSRTFAPQIGTSLLLYFVRCV